MQLNLFGATETTTTREIAPPVMSSEGNWIPPETVAFNAALRGGSLGDAVAIPLGGDPVAAVVVETHVANRAEEGASKILQRIDGEDGMYVNIAESTRKAGGFNVMLRDGDSENTVGGIISIPTMTGARAEAYKMLGIKENVLDKDVAQQGRVGVEEGLGELQNMGTKSAQVEAASPESLSATNMSRVIQDAGEELVHNRRNRIRTAKSWGDIAHLNDALKVKEAVKANVWPKPDYKKLIEDGMQPMVAHIVKQVYDSVAAKPMVGRSGVLDDSALQRYISSLNRVETGLMQWATDPTAVEQWVAANARVAGAMFGRVTTLTDLLGDRKTLLNAVYPDGWYAQGSNSELRIGGGNKLLASLQPGYDEINRAFKALKKGWPEKREAWEIQGFQVVENPIVEAESGGPKSESYFLSVDNRYVQSFPSQSEAESAKAGIKPYALFGKRGFLTSFDSEEEAVASAKERCAREKGQTIGEKGVRVEVVEREGVARRMAGEDISAERMVSEFGLRGLNFGSWLKTPAARAEAQLHLNHAFDSLHDLAEILDVPPKAMSLNGMLGLAIGAQGGGSAAAHFVPGVNEINLTRTSGAGSLAHEWAHAMDHYFATQAGLATSSGPFLTEHVSGRLMNTVVKQVGGGHGTIDVPRFGELRPEIVGAFSVIVDAMNKRLETEVEAQAGQSTRLVKDQNGIAGWLKAIRRDFDGQEDAFDVLATRVQAGDVGEGMVAASRYVSLSPVVAEIRELYKAKHGRIYSLEKSQGLQAWVSSVKFRAAKVVTDVAHVPQVIKSDFAKAAWSLDNEKGGKPYWSTTLEKFARAFDSFVSDELEAKQAKNGYLSHTGRTGNTVPMGDERLAVNAAFRGLVAEVKVRETERGSAMFSAGKPAVSLSMPVLEINAEIRRLRGLWPSMPPVTVVKSVGDLPFESPSNADGAYCNGHVYVVAGNISDLKQLQKVMAHECVMHHSLDEMLGGYGFSKLHHGIQKLKESGDPVVVALAANIRSRYGDLPPEIETKEIVARAGEQCLDDSGQVRVPFGFMKSVFAGVAGWLRDHGISVPFTNTELQGIMHDAGEWIKREEPGHAQAFGVALNSFGGVRAETAPLDALRLAREMHISGEDDRVIWAETGWTFGFADGKPRFEISDDRAEVILESRTMGQVWLDMAKLDAKINTIGQFLLKYPDSPLTHEVNRFQGVRAAYEGMTSNDPSTAREIENYLAHADLYSAYPGLAAIKAAQPDGISGLVNAGAAAFIPDVNLIKYSRVSNADQFKSMTLHELQHAIQEIEGFAPGGSPQLFKEMDLTDKELNRINQVVFDLYERNPEFYRDSVKATQLQLKVADKYGAISDGVQSDPLVQQWWAAIDRRDSYPEANDWFSLKSLERQVARDRIILSPMDQYKSLAGEVEARLTQTRIDMSPVERLAGYPLDDMEVAVPRQVLRSGGKAADIVVEGSYVGKVLDVVDGVATQKVNRDGGVVRHLLSRLSALVGVGDLAEIAYKDGIGVVGGKGVGVGVGR